MIYIDTGSTDVYYNFALEYYFTVEKPLPDTVLLFWRTTPTLMLGKYQNVSEEIDEAYAKEAGIQLVRRMSGGGTIYTDLGGWQFSWIADGGVQEICMESYTLPILQALRALGIEADFNGRNDLTVDGKKFSGNAQYRLGNRVVHHGSLLFDTDLDQLTRATKVNAYKIQSKSIKSVRERVTNLAEHLAEPMTAEAFRGQMVRHLMGESTAEYVLTAEDDCRIRQLAQERFMGWESVYGTNPRFSIQKTGRFAGGSMYFSMEVKRGILEAVQISGDFFATMERERLCRSLEGCRYEREAILERLRTQWTEGCIYRTSLEEIARAMTES